MEDKNLTGEEWENILSDIGKAGDFTLIPCNSDISLEDKSRFMKLQLSDTQKMHLSAVYQQIPAALAAGTMAQAYIAKFPEGLPHTLTALRQGGFGSMIRSENEFVGSASFFSLHKQAAILGVFTAMSVASGQYFLAKINSKLDVLQYALNDILDFLYGDKKAELMSEISFTKYAYENYSSIMAHDIQRTATISSLQNAKKVAINDIEFYISDLSTTVERQEKDFEKLFRKVSQIRDSLNLSLQLYTMSSLLEVYYAQNFDRPFLKYIEKEMDDYIEKCENRMQSCFNLLRGRVMSMEQKAAIPLGKGRKTAEYEEYRQTSQELVDSVSSKSSKELRESIRSVLYAVEQPAEYYFTVDGNVYLQK